MDNGQLHSLASSSSSSSSPSSSSSSSLVWLGVMYVSIRVGLANLAPITDCDEVYNYWEPLHFLHHHSGMQTWEYSPEFALRTYAYLMPLLGLSRLYEALWARLAKPLTQMMVVMGDKVMVFQMLRRTLAFGTALSEWNLCLALKDNGSQLLATIFALTMLTSTGMFHAAPALLPSSTVMMLWMNSAAAQLRNQYTQAIAFGLLAVLALGWPFCAVLFIPLAIEALLHYHRRRTGLIRLLLQTTLHALILQLIVSLVDYLHYDKWTFPTLNIFLYNTSVAGDELYGVEPLSYYIKNILLNFNYVGILGILSLPFLLLIHLLFKPTNTKLTLQQKTNNQAFLKLAFILMPMYLWIFFVFPRPHKEERFLFPIYPMLCIGFATLFVSINDVILTKTKQTNNNSNSNKHIIITVLTFLLIVPAVLLSLSRSIALSDGYTAPLNIYTSIPNPNSNNNNDMNSDLFSSPKKQQLLLCTCGEWYRFPSSFLLPHGVQLAYLKSSFSGQLPQPFTKFGSKPQSLTVANVGKFNDLNQEEMDRYVTIDQCHYLVELLPHGDTNKQASLPECMKYMKQENSSSSNWKKVTQYPFLDAQSTSTLHRVLYLPWLRKPGRNVHYNSYTLFQRQ